MGYSFYFKDVLHLFFKYEAPNILDSWKRYFSLRLRPITMLPWEKSTIQQSTPDPQALTPASSLLNEDALLTHYALPFLELKYFQ